MSIGFCPENHEQVQETQAIVSMDAGAGWKTWSACVEQTLGFGTAGGPGDTLKPVMVRQEFHHVQWKHIL